MADTYFYTWVTTTDLLPQILLIVLFLSFIVGLMIRGLRDMD